LVSGTQPGYPDNSDPTPIYKRGIHFDKNDILFLDGLVLNPKFTLALWVNVHSDGTLYNIQPNENITLKVEGGTICVLERGESVGCGGLVTGAWAHVVVFGNLTMVSLYVNGELAAPGTAVPALIDSPENKHVIGLGFSGFVYSVEISQYPNLVFKIETGKCGTTECYICPPGVCIST
jgi:hypothetical protein